MKLSSYSLAPLFSLALVVGCAVAPAAPEDLAAEPPPGSTGEAKTAGAIVSGGGIVLNLDPTSICSSTPAQSEPLPPSGYDDVMAGETDAAGGCAYYVSEVTGVLDNGFSISLLDDPPGSLDNRIMWSSAPGPCQASSFTYDVFGYVPPRWYYSTSGIKYAPGYWETLKTGSGTGTFAAARGQCYFGSLDSKGIAAYSTSYETKHTILRVATSVNELDASYSPIGLPLPPLVMVSH